MSQPETALSMKNEPKENGKGKKKFVHFIAENFRVSRIFSKLLQSKIKFLRKLRRFMLCKFFFFIKINRKNEFNAAKHFLDIFFFFIKFSLYLLVDYLFDCSFPFFFFFLTRKFSQFSFLTPFNGMSIKFRLLNLFETFKNLW